MIGRLMLVRLALVLTEETVDPMVVGGVVGLVEEEDREDTKSPSRHSP